MKPLCSVRRQGNLHIVTFPESNTSFVYESTPAYRSKPRRKMHYPGKDSRDPEFREFAEQRKAKIKAKKAQLMVSSHFMTPQEEQMLDSFLSMPSDSVSRIIHFNPIQHGIDNER